MLTLALRSVGHRPGRFAATLLVAFLGAAIIMAFNSLRDTAAARGVDDVSAESLGITADVVGGYGTLLVFFAVASTLTVNVRQRGEEIALLRSTGATPAQIRRMVVGEAVVVALAGVLLAVCPAVLCGRALLGMLRDNGQVAGGVGHVFGPVALLSGTAVTLLASAGAAFLAVRRATRVMAGRTEPRRRARTVAGCAALAAGTTGVGATFALDAKESAALMAPPVYGAILLAVGFALFSAPLLGTALGRLGTRITGRAGTSGELAVHNLRAGAAQLSGVLMPLIVFTGMATATLTMQAVENDAIRASGIAKSVEHKNVETLNLVVVGIIVLFSCIMLVNSLYAATSYRSREFGQQRLAGATPGQVLAMVGAEGLLLAVTGVFFGTVAGLAGILPFAAVRGGPLLPERMPVIWLAVVTVAAATTLGTGLATAGRVLRTPAVRAVASAV